MNSLIRRQRLVTIIIIAKIKNYRRLDTQRKNYYMSIKESQCDINIMLNTIDISINNPFDYK